MSRQSISTRVERSLGRIDHVYQTKNVLLYLCVGVATIVALSEPAAAQPSLCDTPDNPFVQIANQLGPLVITAAIMGGLFMSVTMNAVSGVVGDPEQVRHYKRWRNRSAVAAISTPVVAFLVEEILMTMNAGVGNCITLFPF